MGNIVVGVDRSSGSRQALEWALELSRQTGRPVRIVRALQVPLVLTPTGPWNLLTEWEEPEKEAARQELRELLEQVAASSDGPVDRNLPIDVAFGRPADVLLASVTPDDHLVVGARGTGAVRRMLLGSTCRAVVAHAPCPVTVVRPVPVRALPALAGARPSAVRAGTGRGDDEEERP